MTRILRICQNDQIFLTLQSCATYFTLFIINGGVIKFAILFNAVGFFEINCHNYVYFTTAGDLCLLYADTGYVICDHLGDDNDFSHDHEEDYTSHHRNRYFVPKSCVEWKTNSNYMTKAFYSSIRIEIPPKDSKGIIFY